MRSEHLACFGEGIEMVIDMYIELPNTDLRNIKLKRLKEICDTYPDLPISTAHKIKLYNIIAY